MKPINVQKELTSKTTNARNAIARARLAQGLAPVALPARGVWCWKMVYANDQVAVLM
jgi:hypothetical protein